MFCSLCVPQLHAAVGSQPNCVVGFNCLIVMALQKCLEWSIKGMRTCFDCKTEEVEEQRSKISKNIYGVEQISRNLRGQH